jgi:hypothetical protein
VTQIALETLQATQRQLKASRDELVELQNVLATGDASVLDRHALVIEQIRELQKAFVEQRDALSVALIDGGRLFAPQFEALQIFARNNDLDIEALLLGMTIENAVVVECDLECMNLTTLQGLERLRTIRKLYIQTNERLTSLAGIPTRALEELDASDCDLTGDLSELSCADRLKALSVSNNESLTSLKGIPKRTIEEVQADCCGLTGDLSELKGADNLKVLDVSNNEGLTSLQGIPKRAIEEVAAQSCALAGDLSELSGADMLRVLQVSWNQGITSLKGVPARSIEVIEVAGGGLTGDLSELGGAGTLKRLVVYQNRQLVSLKRMSLQAIEEINADRCDLTGDHSFLSQAPKLSHVSLEGNGRLTLDKAKFKASVTLHVDAGRGGAGFFGKFWDSLKPRQP